MNKQPILTINAPDGCEIDSYTFDKTSGVVKFKEKRKSVFERITTLASVLEDNGFTQQGFDKHCEGLTEDEVGYRLAKLMIMSLNEDWTPDWNDPNQVKYVPWFDMRGSSGFRFDVYVSWNSASVVGSRLCLKSRPLCEHIGKHPELTAIYKKFFTT